MSHKLVKDYYVYEVCYCKVLLKCDCNSKLVEYALDFGHYVTIFECFCIFSGLVLYFEVLVSSLFSFL